MLRKSVLRSGWLGSVALSAEIFLPCYADCKLQCSFVSHVQTCQQTCKTYLPKFLNHPEYWSSLRMVYFANVTWHCVKEGDMVTSLDTFYCGNLPELLCKSVWGGWLHNCASADSTQTSKPTTHFPEHRWQECFEPNNSEHANALQTTTAT